MSEHLPASHPEWEHLIRQRDALHSQIAVALTDLHAMDDARPVILGQYSAAFGERLARLHALEIECARLKREIELVQASLNRGTDVDYNTIQETLEAEFAEWQARLDKEARQLEQYRHALGHLLPPQQTKVLRDLFRRLARRLHPDLHPEQSPAHAELWHRVTAAYQQMDVEELEALEILTREAPDIPLPDSMSELRRHIDTLRAKLDKLLHTLAESRRQWPFDQIPVLEDPAATAAKQAELDERITAKEDLRNERKHWLNLLLDH